MTEALEQSGNQYLELIRQVVTNPDVPVEKIKALMDMQLLLEDRKAEQEFDAAMIDAQDEIQELAWDKKGGSSNQYVSYPKMDRMLRPIRKKYGFTQSYDTEPGPTADLVILCSDVSHKGGHKRRYRTPMPIDGQGPKGGGVMTKNQAVNAGTSYSMRNITKMIWNVPVLVDKDDTDGNMPRELVSKEQIRALKKSADDVEADIPALVRYLMGLGDDVPDSECALDKLPASFFDTAVKALERKRQVIEEAKKKAK